MSRNSRKIWPTLILCATLLGVGGAAGFFLRPIILPVSNHDAVPDAPAEVVDIEHGGGDIVEVKEPTMLNMDLQIGKFEVRDYRQNIRIPAKVVERIPQNRRSVTAPISGRIRKAFIAEGQAVQPGEKLFDFLITDESLSQSQVGLLGVISDIDLNQKSLDRIKPLAKSGVVKRSRVLDIELEIDKLTQKRDALKQELSLRGMDENKIRELIENKSLMQTMTVFAPELDVQSEPETVNTASEIPQLNLNSIPHFGPTFRLENGGSFKQASTQNKSKNEIYFTVESIAALEGSNQKLGAKLCELTYHCNMLIEGMAYESDIEKISQANDKDWRFEAHFGEGDNAIMRSELKLFQIDNHVDNQSQTYPIFVELENEIISQTTDDKGRKYVNWQFKPGQRAHLEFPIEIWEKQVVVPLAALAREGLETFVFLKISHTHEAADGTVIHEFQKVPVKVLHTDKHFAVLKKNIKLDVYEEYALDQAYKLNLALKQSAGEGGGHGHEH